MNVTVLGMHRSGTSAVARALVALGGAVGTESELMAAKEDNPLGFYERLDVYDLHEEVLSQLERHWSTLISAPLEELRSTQREQAAQTAREILGRFGAEAPFRVLKDPRLNHLLPLWSEILEPCAYVLAVRSPRAVSDSLARRNGFSEIHSLALWESYNRAAALHLRGRPVLVVSFDRLVNHPEAETARLREWITKTLELHLEEEADAVVEEAIQRSLRHEEERPLREGGPQSIGALWAELDEASASPGGVVLGPAPLSSWAREVLETQHQSAQQADESKVRLHRLEELLSAESIRYAELFERRRGEIEALDAANQQLREQLEEAHEGGASKVELETARQHITSLESKIADLERQVLAAEERAEAKAREVAAAEERADAQAEEVEAARERAEASAREVELERSKAAALELELEAVRARLREVEWVLSRYESSRGVRWAKRVNRLLGRE